MYMKAHSKSKALQQYLNELGILSGPPDAIKAAKKVYRLRYKREWAKSCLRNRNIRPCFTSSEYDGIVTRATLYGVTVTTYVRNLVISAQEGADLIPNKDQLLNVLQAVSMALIAYKKDSNSIEVEGLVWQAETMLLQYLSIT